MIVYILYKKWQKFYNRFTITILWTKCKGLSTNVLVAIYLFKKYKECLFPLQNTCKKYCIYLMFSLKLFITLNWNTMCFLYRKRHHKFISPIFPWFESAWSKLWCNIWHSSNTFHYMRIIYLVSNWKCNLSI